MSHRRDDTIARYTEPTADQWPTDIRAQLIRLGMLAPRGAPLPTEQVAQSDTTDEDAA